MTAAHLPIEVQRLTSILSSGLVSENPVIAFLNRFDSADVNRAEAVNVSECHRLP